MALQINTTLELTGGITVASAYGVLSANLQQKSGDNYQADFQLRIYKDKAAFDAGEQELPIKGSTIPRGVRNIKAYALTQGQYSSLPMATIHSQLIDVLEDGDTDPQYPADAGAWAGLGNATVTAVDLV